MRNYLKKLLQQLLLLGVFLLLGIGVILGILFLQPPDYTDLNLLTAKQGVTNFSRTKILFDYPGNPATIWDEQKKLDRIHGSLPVRIDVIKNTRIVTFKAAAILKSSVDSIDIDKDSASYGGYMGITTGNSWLIPKKKFIKSDLDILNQKFIDRQ